MDKYEKEENTDIELVMSLYIPYGFLTEHDFAETSNKNKALTACYLKILCRNHCISVPEYIYWGSKQK